METLRGLSFKRLGWGFLLAWVFCVFYLELAPDAAVVGRAGEGLDAVAQLAVDVVPVAVAVATLLTLVAFERTYGRIEHNRGIAIASAVGACVATPLLMGYAHNSAMLVALYLLGGVFGGIASGVMWVLWGCAYAHMEQDEAELSAQVSAAMAALLVLAASAMQGWIEVAFVAGLPVLAGVCYMLEAGLIFEANPEDLRAPVENKQIPTPLVALRAMGRSGWGILIACLFTCVLGGMMQAAGAPQPSHTVVQCAVLVSLVFMVCVGLVSTAGPQRMSVAWAFKWMCPVLLCGFAAIIMAAPSVNGVATNVAFGISVAARFAFCLITQVYFARFAYAGLATPTQSYGLGWVFVHAGDLLGVLVLFALERGVAAAPHQVAAVCSVLLVIATMYVLGDALSFAKETSAQASAEEARAAEGPLDARLAQLAAGFNLTPREGEIFALLARGRSVPFIRDELVVSRDTVATHVKHIYQKAGVHSRQELIDLIS